MAEPLGHTLVLPDMVTVGGGMTVITADPVKGLVHVGDPEEAMLTSEKVVVAL